MSEQWLYELTKDDLNAKKREIKNQLKHRTYKYKKYQAPPPETYEEYVARSKARPKSIYEVPYLKGELSV